MARDYQLTKDQKDIQGVFWTPGNEGESVQGVIQLKAGCNPQFETVDFKPTFGKMLPSVTMPKLGSKFVLKGDDVMKAWSTPAKRIFHAHDEQGHGVTLLNCHSSRSNSTLAKIGRSYKCHAAIFGTLLEANDLQFDGISLRFDHQDKWLDRAAFGPLREEYSEETRKKRLSQVTIPFAQNSVIDLQLSGYGESHFFLGWSMHPSQFEIHLASASYLTLKFESPQGWDEVREEILHWGWFFSLAMRTTSDIEEVSLLRREVNAQTDAEAMDYFPVWLPRYRSEAVLHPNRGAESFHFTYDEIGNDIVNIVARWKALQEPWAPVLHRFFAVAGPRDLSIHEQFLSLTQAIESLHRARTGKSKEMKNAVAECFANSPLALQVAIGSKDAFVRRVHKSRNYWTHFGKPEPGDDADVLDEGQLLDLNEQLRWVVEAAILREIGIPDQCVAKVWSPQWKQHTVEFS